MYTPAEKSALITVPDVIENGVKIGEHRNHKGNGYPTITIGAPVEIDGKRGNVSVAIKRTTQNRYSAHRILLPNGAAFIIEKKS